MKMAEDDLVGEERDPFEGFHTVGGGAADELVLTVAKFDEPGGAELLNGAAGVTRSDQMIQFHASSLRGWVGQRLSN